MTQEEKVNKWIEENYTWYDKEVRMNIAKGAMAKFADDLVHEMVMSLYNISPEKWDNIENEGAGIKYYLLSSTGLTLRSNTSPFWRKIRRERMNAREQGLPGSDSNIFDRGEVYEEYDESLYQCFKREMENLHWYQKRIMDEYWFQNMNLDEIREKYGISKRHLVKDLNQAIYDIREACKDCD